MDLALVVAIVHTDKLGAVERKLQSIGVRGVTVIRARGFGEHTMHHDILGHQLMADQVKLEIYVADDRADAVASASIDAAHTGAPGDGIVAILPVRRVFSIRTRSDAVPNRAPK